MIKRVQSCPSLSFKLRHWSSLLELLTTPKITILLSVSNMASSWPSWFNMLSWVGRCWQQGMLEGYLSWAPASGRESSSSLIDPRPACNFHSKRPTHPLNAAVKLKTCPKWEADMQLFWREFGANEKKKGEAQHCVSTLSLIQDLCWTSHF